MCPDISTCHRISCDTKLVSPFRSADAATPPQPATMRHMARGPNPRLPNKDAYAIIDDALTRDPVTRRADLVKKLVHAGADRGTAYRQVDRYFVSMHGEKFVAVSPQARVQVLAHLEGKIADNEAQPADVRLYGEAHGIFEPDTGKVDEEARLAAGAAAIAILRGLQEPDDDATLES